MGRLWLDRCPEEEGVNTVGSIPWPFIHLPYLPEVALPAIEVGSTVHTSKRH